MAEKKSCRILAIDPGYERVGISIIEKRATEGEVIFSECHQTDKKLNHSLRLSSITKEIIKCIELYKPKILAIEKLFFSKNVKTALAVAEARGVIIGQAALLGLEVFEYSPQEVKIAVTGYGKSDKQQVILMINRLVKIKKKINYDDEYDAIAIGLTHLAMNRY